METFLKHDLTTGVHTLGSAQKNLGKKKISKAETGAAGAGGKGTVIRVVIAFAKSYESGSSKLPITPVPQHSTPFVLYGTCMHVVV